MNHLSRRSVTRGAAWALPTVAISTLTPTFAASLCPQASMNAIDSAFATAQQNLKSQGYFCNGQPLNLLMELKQKSPSPYAVSGSGVYIDITNKSRCVAKFTAANPLTYRVEVRNNNVVNDSGRILVASGASGENKQPLIQTQTNNVANKPVGSVNYAFEWNFVGSIQRGQIISMYLILADGYTNSGSYWTDYLTITPVIPSLMPTFESITTNNQCQDYYNQKAQTWTSPFHIDFLNPDGSTTTPVKSGVTMDSRVYGNTTETTLYPQKSDIDGIF